uniref:Uncharacterized protein n=1 Tax=Aegilops tauschii TaxID=37682 RepID=R7W4I0_AEGTA
MKSSSGGHVVGVPVTSKAYGIEEKAPSARDGQSFRKADGDHLAVSLTNPSPYTSFGYKHSSKGQVVHWVSKLSRRAQGFREHVTLGPKISETVKGKLSLGAKILQAGGIERVFRKAFTAEKGERLVKALQCYLYTTGGPIAGMLFVSTKRIAFRRDRAATFTSLGLFMQPVLSRHVPTDSCSRKFFFHMFNLWFMGFLSYKSFMKYLKYDEHLSSTS